MNPIFDANPISDVNSICDVNLASDTDLCKKDSRVLKVLPPGKQVLILIPFLMLTVFVMLIPLLVRLQERHLVLEVLPPSKL